MRNSARGLVIALLLAILPVASQAGVFVSVTIAPPVLPVYEQPPIPGPGFIWTPGYWAWDGSYYWVPGTWVLAPVGLLWTPGYWGWAGGVYVWNAGYWGPHVGFYGGVDYGFGYGGVGFAGGEWRGRELYYNRSVTNVSTVNITNVYNRTVVNSGSVSRVSYNGGAGGITARPNTAEINAEHERHEGAIRAQSEHQTMAAHDNAMRASFNGGHPAIAATARAGVFTGAGVVAAHGAAANRGSNPLGARGENHGSASPQSARSETHMAAANQGGAYPQTARPQTHSGPYPQNAAYSQNRGGYPQGGGAQPRANAYPQARPGGNAQPRANEYPQARPGGNAQPRANAYPQQPREQPGARPEQRQAPQGRGNERPQPQGREDHPRDDRPH